MTRYLRAVHTDHAQLQVEFRDLDGAGGRGLLWWALTHGVKNGDVLPRLVEPETIDGVRTAPGVNVAGYMRAESGVGEAGRLLVAALDAADVPRSIVTYENTRARQQAHGAGRRRRQSRARHRHRLRERRSAAPLPRGHRPRGPRPGTASACGRGRSTSFPTGWRARRSLVDEIWTYSAHAAHAIRAATGTAGARRPAADPSSGLTSAVEGRARPARRLRVPLRVRLRERVRAQEPARRDRRVRTGVRRGRVPRVDVTTSTW